MRSDCLGRTRHTDSFVGPKLNPALYRARGRSISTVGPDGPIKGRLLSGGSRHAFLTALDCASRRLSRSRSAMSIPSACCCASSAATGQGSSRDVVAAAAPTAARLVAGGSAAQPAAAGRSRLFPGRDSIAPLSARQLCRAVRAAAQAAGMSPHTLRHSFTTRLFEQDVGIRVIHTLLGTATYCPRTSD